MEMFNNHRHLMRREKFISDSISLFKRNPQGFDIDYPNQDSIGGYFSFLFDKALYEDELKLDYYPHTKPFIKEMPEFLNYSIYLKHKESKINFK
tara:strand:+ start:607 stop:888 length:282 start_codon:yes stop_codon:yes gene_type:complete